LSLARCRLWPVCSCRHATAWVPGPEQPLLSRYKHHPHPATRGEEAKGVSAAPTRSMVPTRSRPTTNGNGGSEVGYCPSWAYLYPPVGSSSPHGHDLDGAAGGHLRDRLPESGCVEPVGGQLVTGGPRRACGHAPWARCGHPCFGDVDVLEVRVGARRRYRPTLEDPIEFFIVERLA
jgi:hypothetical protein